MKRLLLACTALGLFSAPAFRAQDSPNNPSAPAARSARRADKNAAKAGGGAPRFPSDLKIVQNVVFKHVGGSKLDLLLFLPLEKKFAASPLAVYIHGGGWGGGDKFKVLRRDVLAVVRELTRQGLTCASIEYRLADGGTATAYESAADCRDAVRFLIKHSKEYGLDPQRVGTFGSSAGGHLTLVTALGADRDYPCDPSLDGSAVTIKPLPDPNPLKIRFPISYQ